MDGKCTHNRAEYEALILSLEIALEQGVLVLEIYGDSQLVIYQVIGEAHCLDSVLDNCLAPAWSLLERLEIKKFDIFLRYQTEL